MRTDRTTVSGLSVSASTFARRPLFHFACRPSVGSQPVPSRNTPNRAFCSRRVRFGVPEVCRERHAAPPKQIRQVHRKAHVSAGISTGCRLLSLAPIRLPAKPGKRRSESRHGSSFARVVGGAMNTGANVTSHTWRASHARTRRPTYPRGLSVLCSTPTPWKRLIWAPMEA